MNSLFHLAASLFVLNIYIQILSMKFCMKNVTFIKTSLLIDPILFSNELKDEELQPVTT